MNDKRTITFLHSGDMGDIVSSLATVKEICEREHALAELHLDTSGGTKSNPEPEVNEIVAKTTTGRGLKFNYAGYLFLKPLLMAQPYVRDVVQYIPNSPVDYNLNRFRISFNNPQLMKKTNLNLMFLHQVTFGLEHGYREPWLTIPQPPEHPKRKLLIARSTRYQSGHVLIACLERLLTKDGGFLGTDFEYDVFKDCFGWVPERVPVHNALDAACEIASSETMIVNGTLFYWIAVGLGHPDIVHELGTDVPTTFFPCNPPHVRYFTGAKLMTSEQPPKGK